MTQWRRWRRNWICINWWWCIKRRHNWWRIVLMKASKETTLATCIETTIFGKGRVTLLVFSAYFHKKETKYEKYHHHYQPQGHLTYQLPIQLPHLFSPHSLWVCLSPPPFTKQRQLCIYECIDPFSYLELFYYLQSSYESLVPLYCQAYPYVRLPNKSFQSINPSPLYSFDPHSLPSKYLPHLWYYILLQLYSVVYLCLFVTSLLLGLLVS